jgi:hypothetical protein
MMLPPEFYVRKNRNIYALTRVKRARGFASKQDT